MSDNPTSSETSSNRNNIKTITRNVIFGFGENFGLRIMNFVFNIVIIRTLGDSTFGQYSIVLAWASLFSVAGDIGISQFFTREIARNPEKSSLWFWDIVVLRVILAAFASVITVSGGILYGYEGEIMIGITLFTIAYFLQAFFQPLSSLLMGNERIDILSIFNIIGQVIFISIGGLFLFMGFSFISLIIISFINIPILIALSIWTIKRNNYGPPPLKIHFGQWWVLLKSGFPFAFTQLSLSFAFDSDTIILSRFRSDEIVGWYATGYRLMLSFLIFFGPFHKAILPTLTRQHATDPDSVYPWYYTAVRLIILLTLPIAVGGMLLADKIVLLFYGPEFYPVTIAFVILVWYLPFRYFTSFAGQFANIIKREGASAKIFGFEGVTNILLNLLLIPPFGLVGAAFATVITDVAGAGLFYSLFRKELGPGLDFRKTSRVILAVTIMGLVTFIVRDLNVFIAIAISGIVYIAGVWFLRAISKDEKRWLINKVGSLINRLSPIKIPLVTQCLHNLGQHLN